MMDKAITLPSPQYIELKFVDGGLAARYDPVRGVLEVQRRGMKHYFDLTQVKETVKKTVDKSNNLCHNGGQCGAGDYRLEDNQS